MKLTSIILAMLCAATATAQTPETNKTFRVIESLDELRQQSKVAVTTVDNSGGVYVFDYFAPSAPNFYVDQVDPSKAIMLDVTWDLDVYTLGFKDGDKQYYLRIKDGSLTTQNTIDNSVTALSIEISPETHVALISAYGTTGKYIQAKNFSSFPELTYSSKETPIYLNAVTETLKNAPTITVDGTIVTITADAGCTIMYKLTASDNDNARDADEWHQWDPATFATDLARYSGDVLLSAKATYNGIESAITTKLIHLGTTTGITSATTDRPATYYNLQGNPVADITTAGPGIYLQKRGTEVTKIVIR